MANPRGSKAVDVSCRVYRRLLMAYPKSHRQEYGPAILQLFRDQCCDAWAAARARGLITFWLRALADLLKTSLLERLSNLNRSRIMPIHFRPTIKPLPAFFGICAVVFLPIFLGSVVITLLMPEAYRSTATMLVNPPLTAKPGASADRFPFEAGFIFSSPVLEKTITHLNLCETWGKKYNNGTALNVRDAVSILQNRLDVVAVGARAAAGSANPEGTVVRINSYSDNADEAAKIANALVESYREIRSEEVQPSDTVPRERRVFTIMEATPDYRAVRPNKQLNIAIGTLAGILIGLIVAPLALGIFAGIRNRRSAPTIPLKA